MSYLHTLAILGFAYVAVFVESYPTGLRNWLGAQIDVLPVLMVYCGLNTGLPTLFLTALVGGLCFDTLSMNPLGISILPLFAIGFLVHRFRELILQDQANAQVILGMGASAATPLLVLLLLWSAGHRPLVGWVSLWQWLVVTLGGGVLAPLCFWILDRLRLALTYQRATEPPFRPDREIKRGRA